jgi:hypothetical protein
VVDVEEYCGNTSFTQDWGEVPERRAVCCCGDPPNLWYHNLPACDGPK